MGMLSEPLTPVSMGAKKARATPTRETALTPALLGRRFCFVRMVFMAVAVMAGRANALAMETGAAEFLLRTPPIVVLNPHDDAMLEEIESRGVLYFLDHTDPFTGLARDRAPNRFSPSHAFASTGATGFALTAWCIADRRAYLPPGEALRRVRSTLQFAAYGLSQEHGWFYHFVNPHSGRRAPGSEVSTIDTAIFLQGAIFAREYFNDPLVTRLVDTLYRRIDWTWARHGSPLLTMGWMPETGFLPDRWDSYSELMGMYLLGLGAPRHPLPAASWAAWRRPVTTLNGRTFIYCGPLFTHQYSHAWFDFRGVHDGYADYWRNSVDATLAQRSWSAAQRKRYPHWSADLWGLTSSDSSHGYIAWGTPAYEPDQSDGTVVPCAVGGSLPFAPRECLATLHRMREFDGVWGRYGYADAFNPETGWVSPDVIAIDVGITLVMAENLRSGLVWSCFMRAPEVRSGMRAAGFVSTRLPPTEHLTRAVAALPVSPAGDGRDWAGNPRVYVDRTRIRPLRV